MKPYGVFAVDFVNSAWTLQIGKHPAWRTGLFGLGFGDGRGEPRGREKRHGRQPRRVEPIEGISPSAWNATLVSNLRRFDWLSPTSCGGAILRSLSFCRFGKLPSTSLCTGQQDDWCHTKTVTTQPVLKFNIIRYLLCDNVRVHLPSLGGEN